jgi:hypothetical protein
VSVALLIGAAIGVGWAIFVLGFFGEPSADDRSIAVLGVWAGLCIVSAFMGVAGAIGVLRGGATGRTLAWVASILITVTIVGALAGIAAFMGLWSSRKSSNP